MAENLFFAQTKKGKSFGHELVLQRAEDFQERGYYKFIVS